MVAALLYSECRTAAHRRPTIAVTLLSGTRPHDCFHLAQRRIRLPRTVGEYLRVHPAAKVNVGT
jgi:hypothetical protein